MIQILNISKLKCLRDPKALNSKTKGITSRGRDSSND